MQVNGKIYALKTFQSKDKVSTYYVADCLVIDSADTRYLKGYSSVPIYIDEPVYNGLLNSFKPLMDAKLEVQIIGARASYSLLGI